MSKQKIAGNDLKMMVLLGINEKNRTYAKKSGEPSQKEYRLTAFYPFIYRYLRSLKSTEQIVNNGLKTSDMQCLENLILGQDGGTY